MCVNGREMSPTYSVSLSPDQDDRWIGTPRAVFAGPSRNKRLQHHRIGNRLTWLEHHHAGVSALPDGAERIGEVELGFKGHHGAIGRRVDLEGRDGWRQSSNADAVPRCRVDDLAHCFAGGSAY